MAWNELRDLDLAARPAVRGVLTVPGTAVFHLIEDEWPAGDTLMEYAAVSRRDVLGPGTGWEHVFAVLAALGRRSDDDNVRIFD